MFRGPSTACDDGTVPGPSQDRLGVALRDPLPWHDLVLTAELAERTGYEALFVPEISGREAFATLAGLGRATYRITLGTGVVALDTRSPEVIAMGAATVAELAGGRFVLGIGSGGTGPGSLDRVRRGIAFLREVLAGRSARPAPDAEVFEPWLRPDGVEIWLAALGPKMMRLAGEVADGVLLNWCPPERVARARELVREGAETAGRDPGDVTVAVYVRACVGQEPEVAMAAIRQASEAYVRSPAYRRQLLETGLDLERDLDGLLRSVALVGDPAGARARLSDYREAGADLPVVYPVPALDAVSSIEGTLMALAPSPAVER
jgi:alkanesulfonate monooxygenase SsuD/methylene tetrahydromethanopterin reductase-like flavin-dependent oxidoreductase (luciferase family)